LGEGTFVFIFCVVHLDPTLGLASIGGSRGLSFYVGDKGRLSFQISLQKVEKFHFT
jgi:hypothetical protein